MNGTLGVEVLDVMNVDSGMIGLTVVMLLGMVIGVRGLGGMGLSVLSGNVGVL